MKNKDKTILDLCGGTMSWSKPYKDAGYNVVGVTLPKYDVMKFRITRYRRGVFETKPMWCKYILFEGYGINDIKIRIKDIYGILAAPPCTEFSFAKSNSKYPRDMRRGMSTVIACLEIIWACQYDLPTPLAKRTNLKFWALENPMGLLKRYLGNPVFKFNPYDFGDAYKKVTGLWGYFNEPKKNPCKEYSKNYIHTISSGGKPLKKFDKLLTKEIHPEFYGKLTRTERRAITPPGFAKAFFKANK